MPAVAHRTELVLKISLDTAIPPLSRAFAPRLALSLGFYAA
jgi:hypothetical protein